jgi:hypothetical protein
MATRSKRNYRGRAATRRLRNAMNIHVHTPGQFRRIFKNGLKVMIVVSDHEGDHPCPHCVTYKPIWDSISTTQGRKMNMVSMPSKVYSQTNLAAKKPVNSVPTVLLVSPDGSVSEVEDIRNEEKMKGLVTQASPETTDPTSTSSQAEPEASAPLHIPGLTETEVPMVPVSSKNTTNFTPILPGVTTEPNPLTPVAGAVSQKGGNPWAAFMMAAKQAGPAALLMGAYGALPQRSSGLGRPKRKTRSR